MATRILFRRDSEADWILNNPVLESGEIIVVTDQNRLKIGDGTSTFTQLDYLPDNLDAITSVNNTTTNGINVGASSIDSVDITNTTITTNDSSALVIGTDLVASSTLTVGNHILPSKDEAFDLGSNSAKFRDLYLSGNTITLGNTQISVDENNAVVVQSSNQPVDLKVRKIEVGEGENKITIETTEDGLPLMTGDKAGTRSISTSVDSVALAIALS